MKKNQTYDELEAMAKRTENNLTNPVMQPVAPANVATPGVDTRQVKAKVYDSIFGESPAVQQARAARNASYQDMLNSRRQAAEQQRTDDVKMARWNALGNALTTMVQPLGWGIGGGFSGGAPGGVQQYDDRQYLNAFNRAVKASDDLRNIGTAEDDYKFKLAEEDYKRKLALEDSERQQARMLERQEKAAQAREERDRKLHEQRMELEEQKAAYRQQLADWNATHRVTSKSTGLSVDDRAMLKNLEAYNKYANSEAEYGRKPDPFDKWLDDRGIKVALTNTTTGSPSTSNSTTTQTQTQTQTPTQEQVVPGVTPGWSVLGGGLMYNPSPAVASGQPASAGGGPVFKLQ